MEQQINSIMAELFSIILRVSSALAILRFGVAGLKAIAGDREAVVQAIREVGLGLFIILTARTVVWFIEGFATAVAIAR